MTASRLVLTRPQILAFRRHVGELNERLPPGPDSLRRAAWAGLQDSMPRAALLSIHARVRNAEPNTWADESLVQLWGPRYSTYVVAAVDFALFSVARLPDEARSRRVAEDTARRLADYLGRTRVTDREAAAALGIGNGIRYAATTGTVAIRWEGARAPTVWIVSRPGIDPGEARSELARRYLHIFGPSMPEAFSRWAGISTRQGAAAFDALQASLTAVDSPIGTGWILSSDEAVIRNSPEAAPPARLLPSATRTGYSRVPIASYWFPMPRVAGSCGRHGCGRAHCSSRRRSSGPGGALTRS